MIMTCPTTRTKCCGAEAALVAALALAACMVPATAVTVVNKPTASGKFVEFNGHGKGALHEDARAALEAIPSGTNLCVVAPGELSLTQSTLNP
eukprot:m.156997 g.156997  ORF g.156997 m.156997 type:complete len:93 (+) comp11726_c1_seq19:692-970(+)